MELKIAAENDLPFIGKMDRGMKAEALKRKFEAEQYFIILQNAQPVGVLRTSLFWDKLPFLNLIKIEEHARGQGIGREAMTVWEGRMKSLGHSVVLTSTQSDETAQHFYRKIGYQEAGELRFLGIPGEQNAPELFFIKKL